jgi:chromate reductase
MTYSLAAGTDCEPAENLMTIILGISGSLRRQSFNSALLRAAGELMPSSIRFESASIEGIPLYNGDVETQEGIPAAAAELKERIASADGVLLCTPEYNNSIPGVLKNAIDWMSRPASDIPRVFSHRPIAIIGASPGGFGTLLSQNAWLPVIRTLRMQAWFDGRLTVSHAGSVFNDAGAIVDENVRAQLRDFVTGFAAFVVSRR